MSRAAVTVSLTDAEVRHLALKQLEWQLGLEVGCMVIHLTDDCGRSVAQGSYFRPAVIAAGEADSKRKDY